MNSNKEYIIKNNLERIEKQFFIDIYGKIIRYTGSIDEEIISIHTEIAYQLYPNIERPDDYLMKLGYVMIGSSVYDIPIVNKKPTQAQINTLFDLNLYSELCFLYKNSYPNYEKYGVLID